MICGGVVKSGSPMPRLITSFIVAAMSKKRRMPEGGTVATLCEMKSRMIYSFDLGFRISGCGTCLVFVSYTAIRNQKSGIN
jgi:hypothetical protein